MNGKYRLKYQNKNISNILMSVLLLDAYNNNNNDNNDIINKINNIFNKIPKSIML